VDAKVLCLGLLARGETSGYEIRKEFEEGVLGHIQDASFGSIYPALGKLLEDGLVTVRTVDQDGRPPKKLYSVTPKGRIALVDALMQPCEPDRLRSDFLFRMLFAELFPTRRLEALIADRIERLRQLVGELDSCAQDQAGAGDRFLLGYGLAMYRTQLAYLEEHKHEVLTESLLAERSAAE
jgi:PadR family transcriptional regulator, regulatory protein AphA